MGLVPGLDEQVEALMTAVRLDSEAQLENWRATVAAAAPADRADLTTDDFVRALREQAGAWPSESVEGFVQTLESLGAGVEPVTELLSTLSRDPGTYWQLYHALYDDAGTADTAEAAVGDRFAWLSEQQAQRLADGWGEEWRDYLGQQLDYRWGEGWEATYANADSQGYLDPLIDEWLPGEAEAAADPAETEQLIDQAIQDAIAEIPGAEELTDDDLAEVAAEIREQMAGSV